MGTINNQIPLTDDEKHFIKVHSMEPEWTDQKIAEKIGRSVKVVAKWRIKYGIKKIGQGQLNTKNSKFDKKQINRSNLTDEQKEDAWKTYFISTDRFKRIRNQFIPDDLAFFVESWIKYCVQFDDLKASEEEQLEILILYKVRIMHNQISLKGLQIKEQEMAKEIHGKFEELDLDKEEDRFIYEMSVANNKAIQDCNIELQKLTTEYDKALKGLNATREQREQKEKIGGDTFLGLVKDLNDRDKRKEINKYNELVKLATKNKLLEMQEPHEFTPDYIQPLVMLGKKKEDINEKK